MWLAVISTSCVPNLLVEHLEQEYKPFINIENLSKDSTILIMVLGAGHTFNPKLQITNQLSETELERLIEGIRLHRSLRKSRLVTSGGSGNQSRSQAATARLAAMALGVDSSAIDTLSMTNNTMDEARYFKEVFGTDHTLVLVTDAIHMPRAMMWFEKMGLHPIPAPTNTKLKEDKSNRNYKLLPSSANIEKMEKAMHEYLGILWMKISS